MKRSKRLESQADGLTAGVVAFIRSRVERKRPAGMGLPGADATPDGGWSVGEPVMMHHHKLLPWIMVIWRVSVKISIARR
jgi:hypothetical protein